MPTFPNDYELISLTQEIYEGMPVFGMHQKTFIMTNQTHEQNMKNTGSPTLGFYARNLLISEHGPTHSDAVLELTPGGADIDHMPLECFYGSAICVDLTGIRHPDYIEIKDLEAAVDKAGLEIKKGDIFLMYTGHYDRNYGTPAWNEPYTGLNYESAEWLAKQGVVNIGVDQPAIDLTPDDLKFQGHMVCRDYNITNTENLCNLDKVAGKRFIYMGLPLRIRGGTGSPIRAVAFVEK